MAKRFKVKKAELAIGAVDDTGGWGPNDYRPEPSSCEECYASIPITRKRSEQAFAGHGRARAFCSAKCRQRSSRRRRAHELAAVRAELSQKRMAKRRG